MLNYNNDPLLSNKRIIINGHLNTYGALVRKKDMSNNKKGEVLKKCPYVLDRGNEILKTLLRLKNKNFLKLRNNLPIYLKTKNIRRDTFENWIKKKIYPHLLRHSRLTELAKELTEQELKVFAGWVAGSNMAQIYVHLSGSDVSNKLLSNAGLIDTETIKVNHDGSEFSVALGRMKNSSYFEKISV